MSSPLRRLLALLALLAVAGGAGLTAWGAVASTGLRHPSTTRFDTLLGAGAAWLLLGCAGWWTLLAAAAVVEVCTHGRLRATGWLGCPAPLRRLLLTALGLTLLGGPGSPAEARVLASWTFGPHETRGLALPVRPALHHAPSPALAGTGVTGRLCRDQRVEDHLVQRHLVRPGDTLWALALDRLPRRSTGPEVAALVRRTYLRNRAVIGPEPDLIRPGQRLALPPLRPTHHEERP